jgi:hypothetical protein
MLNLGTHPEGSKNDGSYSSQAHQPAQDLFIDERRSLPE